MCAALIDKFESQECCSIDLVAIMAVHHHRKSVEGIDIFNLTRKCARLLLHCCLHELPCGDKAKAVMDFKRMIDTGWKDGSWCNEPIRINVRTNTVENGIVRLFGLAISKTYGTYMPIEFVN